MKPIGILGGMGPEATILLMQKCLEAVDAEDDADHIPLIVHQNPQVPSRIKALIEGTGEDPSPVLAQMARELERAGAVALAMPCNTAHHYADAVRDAVAVPFLDMIAETAMSLKALGTGQVGMLASPAVRMTGVFDDTFRQAGLEQLWPVDDAAVLDMIRAIKRGVVAAEILPELERQARGLMAQGADHILIACTELSLAAERLPKAIPVSDSLDCLVARIVKESRSDQR